jgi:hypothetical protein
LNLSSGETLVHFSVAGLGSGLDDERIGECWCLVSLRITTRYFHYSKVNDEMLGFCEVSYLRDKLDELLEDKIQQPKTVGFTEPDIALKLYPKFDLRASPDIAHAKEGRAIQGIYAELIINLADSILGYNGQSYTIPLDRAELVSLKEYIDRRIPALEEQWESRRAHR